MKRRIFLAINIPDDIKQKLLEFRKYWQDLPARWTKPENIHITLVFIGYVLEDELENIKKVTSQVCTKHKPFSISLSRVFLGPPGAAPRMVWVEIQRSQELLDLQKGLENALYENSDTGYREKEKRSYNPHITLCRFDPQDFLRGGFNKNDSFDIDYSFRASSVEVMESVLKRTGAEYSIVESFELK